jgi:hypothetical protein
MCRIRGVIARACVVVSLLLGSFSLVVGASPVRAGAVTVPRNVSILGDSTLMGLLGSPQYVDTLRQH